MTFYCAKYKIGTVSKNSSVKFVDCAWFFLNPEYLKWNNLLESYKMKVKVHVSRHNLRNMINIGLKTSSTIYTSDIKVQISSPSMHGGLEDFVKMI